jgi:hypothetical protein
MQARQGLLGWELNVQLPSFLTAAPSQTQEAGLPLKIKEKSLLATVGPAGDLALMEGRGEGVCSGSNLGLK